ncbi:MAG TPA: IS1380 family transposase [Gemmataceae bacterium]|nr:IS1380 family transposase [Gemmataceae bacterium]
MSIQPAWQHTLAFFGTPIVVEPSAGLLTSDAGLLPFRQLDEHLGLSRDFAAVLNDPRDPDLIEHTTLQMVRSRVYGILAGYADQNDHDTLRHDPLFKLLADRRPTDPDLASQPTLSRFENAVDIPSLKRLRALFVEQFITSFDQPPKRLTLDLDAVDDPAHGHQQLTFWHGYYDQNQYLPLFITCPDNDLFVMLSLRPGNVHAALGADDDLEYLVTRLRQVWPDVVIVVRGDCAFGIPRMYEVCERLGLLYTFGLSANAVLTRQVEALLGQAVAAYEHERQQARQEERRPQSVRCFEGFWYQAGTWDRPRYVVAKGEVNDKGTNRRFVVTNRPGATLLPGPTYDEYVERGESENRNKEIKCGLEMDRLSDHRFCANYFRLYLHALAMNLLVRLRRQVAQPWPGEAEGVCATVPAEAQTGQPRQRQFQQRRQRDPLGEGQPCTWRLLLIKVAAEVVVSVRRVRVRLSSSWPHLNWYQRVCERLSQAAPPVVSG